MNIRIIIFVYFITIEGLAANGRISGRQRHSKIKECNENALKQNVSTNFDTLVLSMSWPAAVCYRHLKTSQKSSCKFPPRENQWTIHGLWPSRITRRGSNFCNCSRKFDPKEIASLIPELEEKWTDIKNQLNKTSLWKYEWDKHGTCAVSVDALNTQFKYFNQTLRLYDKFNVTSMLINAKIELEDTYKQLDILEALEEQVGRQLGINCVNGMNDGKNYLASIHFCFDKAFNLIDCVRNIHYTKNCPSSRSQSAEIVFSNMEDFLKVLIN